MISEPSIAWSTPYTPYIGYSFGSPSPLRKGFHQGVVKQRARGPDGKNGGAEASPFGEFFSWCRGNLCTAPAWYAAATGHGGAKHRGGGVGRLVGRPVATWGWWLLKVVFNKKKWTVKTTRCWWIKYLFFFTPKPWGNDPIWRVYL